MRAITLADIEVAARVLVCVPPADRRDLMQKLVCSADTADRYRKKMGRQHLTLGSGTLMSAAQSYPKTRRHGYLGSDMLHAISIVVSDLAERCTSHAK